jgi:hypothetical protein
MKKYFFLLTALLLVVPPLNATFPVFIGEDGDPEEIDLNNPVNGEEPTSLNTCTVHAFKTSDSIIVRVSGYIGNISVAIIGLGGSVYSGIRPIIGNGEVILDITSLSEGDYMIYIHTSICYQGTFRI